MAITVENAVLCIQCTDTESNEVGDYLRCTATGKRVSPVFKGLGDAYHAFRMAGWYQKPYSRDYPTGLFERVHSTIFDRK